MTFETITLDERGLQIPEMDPSKQSPWGEYHYTSLRDFDKPATSGAVDTTHQDSDVASNSSSDESTVVATPPALNPVELPALAAMSLPEKTGYFTKFIKVLEDWVPSPGGHPLEDVEVKTVYATLADRSRPHLPPQPIEGSPAVWRYEILQQQHIILVWPYCDADCIEGFYYGKIVSHLKEEYRGYRIVMKKATMLCRYMRFIDAPHIRAPVPALMMANDHEHPAMQKNPYYPPEYYPMLKQYSKYT